MECMRVCYFRYASRTCRRVGSARGRCHPTALAQLAHGVTADLIVAASLTHAPANTVWQSLGLVHECTSRQGVSLEVSRQLHVLNSAEVRVLQADTVVGVDDAQAARPAVRRAREEQRVEARLLVVVPVRLLRKSTPTP